MHRSIPTHVLLAAVAALLAADPSHAGSTASSTLSDFHIALTDLDPSDDIAPALALDPQSRSTVLPRDLSSTGTTSWRQQGDAAFAPVSSSGELDGMGGAASFAGDPLGAGAQISASAVSDNLSDVSATLAYVDTQPSGQGRLVLGPQTRVTFSGAVAIDWRASSVAAAAYGEVDMALWQLTGDNENLIRGDVSEGYFGNGPAVLSGTATSPLAISFANDTDAPMLLGYQVDVGALATELAQVPSPVDEPAEAALLLAGLGALRWGARRR